MADVMTKLMGMFKPHPFAAQMEYAGQPPRVLLTWEVFNYLRTLMTAAQGPISWVGTVEQLDAATYIITRVFLPTQKVTHGAATIEAEDWAALIAEITAKYPGEDGAAIINQFNFYGHAVVAHATTDDTEMRDLFAQGGKPWCVLGTFSSSGKIELNFYQLNAGIRFRDVPWGIAELEDEALAAQITAAVGAKVRKGGYSHRPFAATPPDPGRPVEVVTRQSPRQPCLPLVSQANGKAAGSTNTAAMAGSAEIVTDESTEPTLAVESAVAPSPPAPPLEVEPAPVEDSPEARHARVMLGEEYDRLMRLAQVERVVVTHDCIQVFTTPLYAIDPRTNVVHEIGRFRIEIYDHRGRSRLPLKFYNLDRVVCGRQAPHVNGMGEAQSSSLDDIMSQLLAQREYSLAATMAIAFVESVEMNSSWGPDIDRWPVVTSKPS